MRHFKIGRINNVGRSIKVVDLKLYPLINSIAVPDNFKAAWDKALRWHARMNGWEQSFEKALNCVKNGVRPLLYGFHNHQLVETGLDIINMGWISVASRRFIFN